MKLKVSHLSRSYGNFKALNDFDLTFEPGIYALLGPNGAGKSTLIKLLSLNLRADSGEIICDGRLAETLKEDYRRRIGYVPQQQKMPDSLRAVEFMSFMAALKGMTDRKAREQIDRLLESVGLKEKRNEKIGSFSGGMKQRLLIAQALLDDPDFLILDEPTAGLDPRERIRIRNILSREAAEKIVLYATHVVSDIEGIADQVVLLRKGEITAVSPPSRLLEDLEGKVFEIKACKKDLEQIKEKYLVSQIKASGSHFLVRIITDDPDAAAEAENVSPNLEDVYLYYFGQEDPS